MIGNQRGNFPDEFGAFFTISLDGIGLFLIIMNNVHAKTWIAHHQTHILGMQLINAPSAIEGQYY